MSLLGKCPLLLEMILFIQRASPLPLVLSISLAVQTADLHTTLNEVICFLHFTLKTTPYLLKVDYDLLLDSLVMCWEILRPALSSITTQDYLGCKAFLTHTMGIMVQSAV